MRWKQAITFSNHSFQNQQGEFVVTPTQMTCQPCRQAARSDFLLATSSAAYDRSISTRQAPLSATRLCPLPLHLISHSRTQLKHTADAFSRSLRAKGKGTLCSVNTVRLNLVVLTRSPVSPPVISSYPWIFPFLFRFQCSTPAKDDI
jgi:hypothetical protein